MRLGIVGLQILVLAFTSILFATKAATAGVATTVFVMNQLTLQNAAAANARARKEEEARKAAACDAWIATTPYKNLQLRIFLNSLGSAQGEHLLTVSICNYRNRCATIANIDSLSRLAEGHEISSFKIADRNSCDYLPDAQAYVRFQLFSTPGYRTRIWPRALSENRISIAELMKSNFNIPLSSDDTTSIHVKLR